jgi:hypothetical protein
VHVHIEELVLEGFAPGDRRRVADGLERELRRLVQREVPASWRRGEGADRLRAPAITLPRGAAERAGESIAAAVHIAIAKKEPR